MHGENLKLFEIVFAAEHFHIMQTGMWRVIFV